MSVIAIDTASRERARVLRASPDGTVLAVRDFAGGTLDRSLPGILADLLDDDCAALVVLTGPGSYSGVRAGMAAALGVAAARILPLPGLDNLAAIAAAVDVVDGAFHAVADAGRGGVYIARFTRRGGAQTMSEVHRVLAGQVDPEIRCFATTAIAGVAAELVDPVTALAAAVPFALALPALDGLGLHATHAAPAQQGTDGPGATVEAL